MSRLTDENGICVDCEGIGYCMSDCMTKKRYDKLAHYEDLEEAGRLIELPCKLYEEVWVSHKQFATFKTSFERKSTIVDWMEQGYVIGHTKAEAEQKLAELKGDSEER